MKTFKNIFQVLLLIVAVNLISCEEENSEFGDVVAPTNVQISAEIQGQDLNDPDFMYGDGSGLVTFTVSGDNAITYQLNFGDGEEEVAPSGTYTHRYTTQGVNEYTVTVNAVGTGGVMTTSFMEIEVYAQFSDQEAENFLSGPNVGDTKTWYWAANLPSHVGLGPVTDDYGQGEFAWPAWWNTIGPWDDEKSCMYANEFVFTRVEEGLTFEQTVGPAFIPGAYAETIGVAGDVCHDETVVPSMFGVKDLSFFPSSSKAALEGSFDGEPYRGTSFKISDDGFMGWYVGASTYDIVYMDADQMYVRIIQDGDGYAWYQLFTSTDPASDTPPTGDLVTFIAEDDNFDTMVWSDEFDVDGAPDADTWGYDLGATGWGNNESQNYTDRADNVIVEDGVLKIIAKTESYQGANYTSARIKTQDRFSFQYGRFEIRAKLPEGGGTWPALWMLGQNFADVGWPKCGEIDIMEHVGNNQNNILGTLHWEDTSGNYAGYGTDTTIANASSEFHIYELEWTSTYVKIFVDGNEYFVMNTDSTMPFYESDFFFIFNVAMGGTLGGNIDPSFTESTMEVDYVRVYQ